MMINFTIPIPPVSLQFSGKRISARGGKVRFFRSGKAQGYIDSLVLLARPYRPPVPLEGALILHLTFILPRPKKLMRVKDHDGLIPHTGRPDRDNLIKSVQDALTKAGFWLDDAQIFDGRIAKFYAEKTGKPRIEVVLRTI